MSISQALASAKPGAAVTYHLNASLKGCPHLDQVRRLYDKGHVDLVQKRVVDGGFAYIAQFRRTIAKVADYATFKAAGL